jgi:alkylation response protein AidB-like acyl-CoA dehydrogenase
LILKKKLFSFQSLKIPDCSQEAFSRLTSRDKNKFWTSGQWMTERKGGSDVAAGTETVATEVDIIQNLYNLNGYKWFSSATDADMAITLARIKDHNGNIVQVSHFIR